MLPAFGGKNNRPADPADGQNAARRKKIEICQIIGTKHPKKLISNNNT
jgi:hypothetical protein